MEISPINNSLRIYKTIPKSIKPIPVFIKRNSFNEDFENISPGNPYLNLNINYHLPISSFVGNLFNLNFENNKLLFDETSNDPVRGGFEFPITIASGYLFFINFDTLSNSG